MKHVIIGTAGHVDHGKTALVKALTGVDTDRLEEEKRRGLTIEPGFARLDWEDGLCAGIVDVPGHERFIKNMLAGAGGIDLALLVIAADEGVMPQTVEHFDVLSMLGVKSGVTVLTKCDLVDREWLDLLRREAADFTAGTFLEGKPIAEVSVRTGQGIDELRGLLRAAVLCTEERNVRIPFRLPIDRVFSAEGFGTVVTGTLIEGAVHMGDAVELAPGGMPARVRGLQVHGRETGAAFAGQRVAINLAGVKRSDVRRGDAAVRPGSVRPTRMLDVRLRCLKDSKRSVANGSRLHFYHGTSAQLARVILLDRDTLAPGESCCAQLRLTEEAAVKKGDRFIVRFYSPTETVGGGVVLDEAPPRHRRNDPQTLAALAVLERGSGGERALQALAGFGEALPTADELAARLGIDAAMLAPELEALRAQGKLVEPLEGRYIAVSALDALWERCEPLLAAYHAKNPLHAGMRAAELRQKLLRAADRAVCDALFAALLDGGKLRRAGDRYALSDFEVRFTARQRAIRDALLELSRSEELSLETTDGLLSRFERKDREEARRVLESVTDSGALLRVAQGRYLRHAAYEKVRGAVEEHFSREDTLTLAALRDRLGISREDTLTILEFLDRGRVTRREGNFRRLDHGFPP